MIMSEWKMNNNQRIQKKNFPNTIHTSSVMPANNSFSAINFVLSIRIRGIIFIKLE